VPPDYRSGSYWLLWLSGFSWQLPSWAWATRSATHRGRSRRRGRRPHFVPDPCRQWGPQGRHCGCLGATGIRAAHRHSRNLPRSGRWTALCLPWPWCYLEAALDHVAYQRETFAEQALTQIRAHEDKWPKWGRIRW